MFVLYGSYAGILHLGFIDGVLVRWAGKNREKSHAESEKAKTAKAQKAEKGKIAFIFGYKPLKQTILTPSLMCGSSATAYFTTLSLTDK